jgi:predicted ATPase/class 3 adenylate cyclase
VQASSGVTTFLFTDIEHSSRLWEEVPDRMGPALARHDALARSVVQRHHGELVKMTGDGMHAVFDDPQDALRATLEFQQALEVQDPTGGLRLAARCGLHAGVVERRDNDYFGNTVNRAARIMGAAHGGQVLLSQVVADLVANRLPADVGLRDLGNVRLRDLAGPERLYQVVHPTLRQAFPPLRSLESFPNNLPQQMTSFIGRERELADVGKLLAEHRLVTLHGTGGIGKTRLSLQAAADALAGFVDGAWFVELAPLTDPGRVPQAVATVLGVKEDAGRPVAEALIRTLRDRSLLLVLDNCEHLVQACAELAVTLLQAAPRVNILATSREPLNVRGETTYPMPVMSLPQTPHGAAITAPTQSEAVRLFVERATAVNRAFALTPQNAAAVVEICRRLDGIPLALELAAARARSLSVENIAARLSDRFNLLDRGDRTALPRQQTLRALIDWSHDLLTEQERVLFRRLAVFAGGWTLSAAEAVGAGGEIERSAVLDLQSQLVERSLVAMEAEGGRYRLLDTVRQYAQEHLDRSNDGPGVHARHLDYFVAFAEEARLHVIGPDEAAWLPQLDIERENLLSAHAWCDRADDTAETGLRLVSALKPYLFNRGMLGLAYQITAEALAHAGAQDRTLVRCRGLFDAGQVCFFMGRYGDAARLLEESLVVARELGDSRRIAHALQPLGMSYVGLGDLNAARGYLEEALALARVQGDKRQVAGALNSLGQLRRVEGALDAAEPIFQEALQLAREVEDHEAIAVMLLNLAMVGIGRAQCDGPRYMLVDVIAIAGRTGSKPAGQSALEVSAALAMLCDDWSRAARRYGAAEALAAQTGIARDPADTAFLAPLVAQMKAHFGAEAYARLEAEGRKLSYEDAMAEAEGWLAHPS